MIRPLNTREETNKDYSIVKCIESQGTLTVIPKTSKFSKSYSFDRVFGPASSQATLYKDAITPIGMVIEESVILDVNFIQWRKC